MAHMQCIVVTPEATVKDCPAEFIALPLFDGEIGIAPGHAPLIGRMGYGELRLSDEGKTERYYVDGGFVHVLGQTVTILTNRAIPASLVNREAVAKQLAAASNRPINTPELAAIKERLLSQARAQLRVADRAQ